MPTKTQAKGALDALLVVVKDYIDNMLPAGVNIKDGWLSPSPDRFGLQLNAGGNNVTAEAWTTTIVANLSARGFVAVVERYGKRKKIGEGDGVITITSPFTSGASVVTVIQNIGV